MFSARAVVKKMDVLPDQVSNVSKKEISRKAGRE